MKAAIYCRVSTDDQERDGTSLQTQLEACQRYCDTKGYEVVTCFNETYSGLKYERPKLSQLRASVSAGQIDVIVVYSLDRLTRNPKHWVMLTLEMDKGDVRLEAVTETVESSETGDLISYIRAYASKLEADKIRERTMRGKDARLKEGRLPQGTGKGLFGYSWDKEAGKRRILEGEAAIVQRIFQMAIEGKSVHSIAVALNEAGAKTKGKGLWHPLTVKRILTNEAYTGVTVFRKTKRLSKSEVVSQPEENWVYLPDVTPPIVDSESFTEAQRAMVEAKDSRPLSPNAAYLLTGFIKCSKCDHTLGGTTQGGRYRYYKCRGAVPTTTRGKVCDARHIKADEIEAFVWGRLVDLWASPLTVLSQFTNLGYDSSKSVVPMLNRQIKKLTEKLKTYETAEKKLYRLLFHENTTEEFILEELAKLRERQKEDEAQLRRTTEWKESETQRLHIPKSLTDIVQALRDSFAEDMELSEKRTILDALEVKVVALPGDYKFTCFIDAELSAEVDQEAESAFEDSVREFERVHPELTFSDLIDHAMQLPDDTMLGRMTNQAKRENLVTIERTWASQREYSRRSRRV